MRSERVKIANTPMHDFLSLALCPHCLSGIWSSRGFEAQVCSSATAFSFHTPFQGFNCCRGSARTETTGASKACFDLFLFLSCELIQFFIWFCFGRGFPRPNIICSFFNSLRIFLSLPCRKSCKIRGPLHLLLRALGDDRLKPSWNKGGDSTDFSGRTEAITSPSCHLDSWVHCASVRSSFFHPFAFLFLLLHHLTPYCAHR